MREKRHERRKDHGGHLYDDHLARSSARRALQDRLERDADHDGLEKPEEGADGAAEKRRGDPPNLTPRFGLDLPDGLVGADRVTDGDRVRDRQRRC